jgi:hypothetical protein
MRKAQAIAFLVGRGIHRYAAARGVALGLRARAQAPVALAGGAPVRSAVGGAARGSQNAKYQESFHDRANSAGR